MTIEPLQRANFVDQAYEAIKQLIVGGELEPGSQLNIDALARRLGVSNSPIREALRRLEYERWVETVPFKGAFVRPLDEAELIELYEFREIIELAALRKLMGGRSNVPAGARFPSHPPNTAARVAWDRPAARGGKGFPRAEVREGNSSPAKRGAELREGNSSPAERGAELREGIPAPATNPDHLSILRQIVGDIEAAVRAGDALQYLQADARFHQAIVDLAGNRRLSDLFRTMVEQGRSFMLGRTPEAMARCSREPDEHVRLLELIEKNDKRGACKMLKAHLRISRDEIRQVHQRSEKQ